MTGKFITFEGTDGCGKSTQLKRIQEWLLTWWPHPIIITREPGGTDLGRSLRSLLLANKEKRIDLKAELLLYAAVSNKDEKIDPKAELLLYAADRAQHVESVIKPQLAAGAIVLCDRYTDSTVAYQGYGRGVSLGLVSKINQLATGGLNSDLTLWLDAEVEVGLARAKQRSQPDQFEQSDISFYKQVRHGYRNLAKANPKRIVQVNANMPINEVTTQIKQIISTRFNRCC